MVPASIVRQFGPLGYEINVDGRTRPAHVDHLKPRLVTESQREELTLVNSAPGCDGDDPTPLVVVNEEELEEVMNTIPCSY